MIVCSEVDDFLQSLPTQTHCLFNLGFGPLTKEQNSQVLLISFYRVGYIEGEIKSFLDVRPTLTPLYQTGLCDAVIISTSEQLKLWRYLARDIVSLKTAKFKF